MGGGQSKAEVLTQIMNKVSINVLNKNSNSSVSVIDQSNTFTLVGDKGGKYSQINQINSAKINVNSLLKAVSTGQLQSDLMAELKNTIKQEAPAIGYSTNDVKVSNVISNSVKVNITNETLQKIKNDVKQNNAMLLVGNTDSVVELYNQKNEAELIVKMISDTNSDIVSKLQTTGAISTDLSQSTASLLPDFGGTALIFIAILGFALFFIFGGSFGVIKDILLNPIFLLASVFLILLFIIIKPSNESSFYGGCPCSSY